MYTLTDVRHNEIVDDTLVDTYDDCEQVASFAIMLQENIELPLSGYVIGMKVEISNFTSDNSRVIALMSTKFGQYSIDLRDIDIVETLDTEWIAAYKKWRDKW